VELFTILGGRSTVTCFKKRSDKLWSNQDVLYNFKAPFFGTGSRSYSECDCIVYSITYIDVSIAAAAGAWFIRTAAHWYCQALLFIVASFYVVEMFNCNWCSDYSWSIKHIQCCGNIEKSNFCYKSNYETISFTEYNNTY